MKSRGIKIKIACCMLAVLLALFTVGYTFAWFSDYYSVDIKLYTDSDGGYFASGSGASTDPYIISSYKHLYNLAWLQNTGKIFDDTYFELDNDIDMAPNGYIVIPPIGNDTYPFNGVFNGGGYTISNLVVSTDKNKLTNFPTESAEGYAFSQYVGLFGCTDTDSNIYNFILDNPIVEVASSNTKYSTSSESCVGLAIGYVANKASSIGVIGGVLAVQQTGYTTYNSILGTISPYLNTSVTGGDTTTGGSTGGTATSDNGGTGLFVPQIIYKAVEKDETFYAKIGEFDSKDTTKFMFSNELWLVSSNKSGSITTDNYLSLGVFSLVTGTNGYTSTSYYIEKASSSITSKSFEFNNTYIDSSKIDSTNTGEISTSTTSIEKSDFIKKVFESGIDSYEYYLLIANSPDGKTFKGNVISENYNDGTNENGILAEYSSTNTVTYNIYDNTIKFNVIDDSGDKYVYILAECTKGTTAVNGTTYGYLNIHKSSNSTVSDFYYNTGYNNFVSTYSEDTGNPKESYTYRVAIPVDSKVYGFAVPISKVGFYNICQEKNSGINIYYLAVDGVQNGTTSSATGSDSDGKYDSEYDVSAIDFIYSDVTIVSGDFMLSDNTTAYTPTGTRVYFSSNNGASVVTTAVLIIAYTRGTNGTEEIASVSYTLKVTYYTADSDTPAQSQSKAYIPTSGVESDDSSFSKYNAVLSQFSNSE